MMSPYEIIAGIVTVLVLAIAGLFGAKVAAGARRSTLPKPEPVAPPPISLVLDRQEKEAEVKRTTLHVGSIDEVKLDAKKPINEQSRANADWLNGGRK